VRRPPMWRSWAELACTTTSPSSSLVIAKMEEIRKVYEVYVSPQVQQSAWLLLGLNSDEQKLNVNVN